MTFDWDCLKIKMMQAKAFPMQVIPQTVAQTNPAAERRPKNSLSSHGHDT
jgi:hypothetical protein